MAKRPTPIERIFLKVFKRRMGPKERKILLGNFNKMGTRRRASIGNARKTRGGIARSSRVPLKRKR